jgi:hypothetical protein
MFGSSIVIGNDILDIGTHKFDCQRDQRAIGSGAMIPRLALGEPGQFEVPNVADVSRNKLYQQNVAFKQFFHSIMNNIPSSFTYFFSRHTFVVTTLPQFVVMAILDRM